ncbi:TPA: DNA-methyltransferase [Pseudomonas aeruginosa]|uniref:DNA-methyltransferase n=1 Tax=Pseudomonas aeruginosa TaxID=287 RepID=UPI000EB228CE|nr:site-specific DNA-methyltransferase [Pseudomonas aeruginosa]EKB8023348.1 site-specific DNA-methyltransferase [Pseudomonas aeruginosa]EKT7964281.1 site-specific DNA-methyltransferase [Pseudomonas aeruginosa]MBV6100762.1 site-specific DNA-methyltransferase [Pseudomonas aeruginosa]MCK1836135.1 site-specific DNA-methyltransferase [Pseudomonas aeruginosa]RUC22585.1 site-specific DNA-methyltransferase [Pseudomonas aeruginosa]
MNPKHNLQSDAATTQIVKNKAALEAITDLDYAIWQGDAEALLTAIPMEPAFDLVVSSPPYNIGKSYEKKGALEDYLQWQERILDLIIPRVNNTGSICWQVGNFVDNGMIVPLDIEMAYIFKKHGLKLRNRIIWHFGHGLHNKHRFSGRYEVVMWYSKTDDYQFDLDPVRIPAKYPGKRHFKGPKKGLLSGNPLGKNPEDVWSIPNVKANHIEKTNHPCQFPVGLIERLVLSMTKPGQLVFDPFAGVGSSGVAAALHERRFIGCELISDYAEQAKERIDAALAGTARYRPHDKELYDHTKSKLSQAVWPEFEGVEGE